MGIDDEIARGVGHPICDRQTSLTQNIMAAVTQRRGLDGVEDFGGGADPVWGDRCGSRYIAQGSIIPFGVRYYKEKEAT